MRQLLVTILTIAVFFPVSQNMAQQQSAGLDLDGAISDKNGKPLEGATVFVYTAAPRFGPPTI